MARLRLLLGVLLIAAGATAGGLTLTGHYGTHTNGQSLGAARQTQVSSETFIRLISRQRLVAKGEPASARPSKPSGVASLSKTKAKRPQQAVAQWPWGLFSN